MTDAALKTPPSYEMIPLAKIRESPLNPRKTFRNMEDLADSIAAKGVLQPITVRPMPDSSFEVVFGARRFRAAGMAKQRLIPAMVRELSDREAVELMIVENAQREDVDPLEEAEGYRVLHEEHGIQVDEIAARVGKSKGFVYGRIKLTKLCLAVREAVLHGGLSASIATEIARLPTDELQLEAMNELAAQAGGHGVEQLPFRHAVTILRDNFLLRLADAPFDTKDATLAMPAGSCVSCPKRTGAQPGLFEEVKGADVCTDRECFKGKVAAHGHRLADEAKAKGLKVLTGKAADRAAERIWSNPYVDPAESAPEDPKGRTYAQLLGKKSPDPVVLVTSSGKVEQRLERAAVDQALAEKGLIQKRDASSAQATDPVARALEEELGRIVRRLRLESVAEKAATTPAEVVLRLVANDVVETADIADAARVLGWIDEANYPLGLEKLRAWMGKATHEQRRALLLVDLFERYQHRKDAEIVELLGPDEAAIRKAAKRELEAGRKAAASKPAWGNEDDAPSKKPAAKARPKAPSSKAGKRAAKRPAKKAPKRKGR